MRVRESLSVVSIQYFKRCKNKSYFKNYTASFKAWILPIAQSKRFYYPHKNKPRILCIFYIYLDSKMPHKDHICEKLKRIVESIFFFYGRRRTISNIWLEFPTWQWPWSSFDYIL